MHNFDNIMIYVWQNLKLYFRKSYFWGGHVTMCMKFQQKQSAYLKFSDGSPG